MGEEECAHCNMMITEEQFAAQLVTSTGKAHSFDAIECLAAEANEFDGEIHSLWIRDYFEPGEWFDATQATYLHSEELSSPMGLNLSAYRDRGDAEENQTEHGGELLEWDEVQHLVLEEWGHSH